MAKKIAEEAIEVAIDAVGGKQDAVIRESADLLYNLTVLWVAAGIHPQDIWDEMDRRERAQGIAEKLPKQKAAINTGNAGIPAPRRRVLARPAATR